MSEPLSTRWRQPVVPVVVENRAAANGNLAAQLVAAAEGDGHSFRPGLHPVAEPVPDARDFGSRTVAGNPDDLAGSLGREREIYRPLIAQVGATLD